MTEEWNSLNSAAFANLNDSDLKEFFRYRKELFEDGHFWEHDAEDILKGFIWDCIEYYE